MRINQIEQGCIYQTTNGLFREVIAISGPLVQFRRGKTGRSEHILTCTIFEMAKWAVKDVTEERKVAA